MLEYCFMTIRDHQTFPSVGLFNKKFKHGFTMRVIHWKSFHGIAIARNGNAMKEKAWIQPRCLDINSKKDID